MSEKAKKSVPKKSKKERPFLVNVDPDILEKVRRHKEKTGVQIGKFYDLAALEKLEKLEAENKILAKKYPQNP